MRTASESILEDLLETEELKDRKVDGRVEAETALVGTERGVELDAVSTVDLELALVVLPSDTELDDALGDGDDVEGSLQFGGDLEELGGLEGGDKLCGIISIWVATKVLDEVCAYRCRPARTRAQKEG